MKYMTQKNILIALGAIVALALIVWGIQNSPASQQKTNTPEEQTTTTAQTETVATSTETEVQDEENNVEVTTTTQTETTTQTNTGTQQATNATTQAQQEPKELGPRQPATVSPLAALQFFAEAYAAGDQERALSYFADSVRDQYRASFKEYEGREHPVVRAYFTGEVGPVELIQPEHGIYEVRVRPFGSKGAYTVNFFFENGEFRIWEL